VNFATELLPKQCPFRQLGSPIEPVWISQEFAPYLALNWSQAAQVNISIRLRANRVPRAEL
jgi:hypothetical protein